MKSVIVIEDNLETCAWITDKINRHSQFFLVATASSGREGVLLIEHHRPDLIILDIIMPDDDGLKVLKHIREKCEQYNPVLFVVTALKTNSMQRLLSDLEIDFAEYKPLICDSFLDKLNLVSYYTPEGRTSSYKGNNIADIVEYTLSEVGVPSRLAGYRYIKVALFYILDNPSIKADVYSVVCATCHCTYPSAERNIRTAIETSMTSDLYRRLFGEKRVSNLTFLHELALLIGKRSRK